MGNKFPIKKQSMFILMLIFTLIMSGCNEEMSSQTDCRFTKKEMICEIVVAKIGEAQTLAVDLLPHDIKRQEIDLTLQIKVEKGTVDLSFSDAKGTLSNVTAASEQVTLKGLVKIEKSHFTSKPVFFLHLDPHRNFLFKRAKYINIMIYAQTQSTTHP